MTRLPSLVLVLVLVLAPALAACVPAGTDEDPHGGAAARLVPSAAASGQPFVTADGWTVTVDRIALQVLVNATTGATPEQRANGTGGVNSAGGVYVVDASKEQSFVLRALPAQRADVLVQLTNRTVGGSNFLTDPPDAHGVDSALDARFSALADSADPSQQPATPDFAGFGPTLILTTHAEKGGRTVRFDLGLDAFGTEAKGGIDLQPNALTTLTFVVRAEAFFTNDSGLLTFDPFAAADRDGDGQISPRELRLYDVPPCNDCTPGEKAAKEDEASQNALSSVLEQRTGGLLVVE